MYRLVLILVLLALAGCSSNAPADTLPSRESTILPPAQVTEIDGLIGLWTTTSTQGTQTDWYFKPDGSYTNYIHRGEQVNRISGKYWFEDGIFMIRDDFCPTPGSYTITLNGSETAMLMFTLVDDGCAARVEQLSSGAAVWLAEKPAE